MSTASVPNTFASAVTATGLQLDQNYSTIVAYLNEPLNRNNWATDSGNTNTVVLTFQPAVSAYSAGLEITFKAANTNTGATVINANSLGNKNFVQPGGAALASGQMEANGIYKAAYDGTQFVYIGQNVLAASQAQMETATSAVTFVSPNSMKWHPGVAKALAVFNGTNTGTITAGYSFGIAKVLRVGAGSYALTISSPFSSLNYGGIVQNGADLSGGTRFTPQTTATALAVTLDSSFAPADSTYVVCAIWGDLP